MLDEQADKQGYDTQPGYYQNARADKQGYDTQPGYYQNADKQEYYQNARAEEADPGKYNYMLTPLRN